MSRYVNWGSTERKFLSTYLDFTPSDNSFICKSHLMEAKRHHNDPDFKPKWKLGNRNVSLPLKNVLILSALNQYMKNLLNLHLHLPLSLRRSRWLLHQLIVYLDSHMLYRCVHKKFETILFRKGIDVLISLSWAALGMLDTGENYSEITTNQHSSTSMLNEKQVLTFAGSVVNDIMHKEIKKETSDSWLVDPT